MKKALRFLRLYLVIVAIVAALPGCYSPCQHTPLYQFETECSSPTTIVESAARALVTEGYVLHKYDFNLGYVYATAGPFWTRKYYYLGDRDYTYYYYWDVRRGAGDKVIARCYRVSDIPEFLTAAMPMTSYGLLNGIFLGDGTPKENHYYWNVRNTLDNGCRPAAMTLVDDYYVWESAPSVSAKSKHRRQNASTDDKDSPTSNAE